MTDPEFLDPQTNPFGLSKVFYFVTPTFVDFDGAGDGDLDGDSVSNSIGGSAITLDAGPP